MRIGLHVSASGGAHETVKRAQELECETFQFFSRSPQGGPAPRLTQDIIASFKNGVEQFGFKDVLIHTPYFINLASPSTRITKGSISIIREELERASALAVPYVVTHLGASKEGNRDEAVKKVAEGLKKIISGYKGSAMLLLENAAGSGTIIGSRFEELHELLAALPAKAPVGVCLDTCHLFASGYDLRNTAAVNATLADFDSIVGKQYLTYIHANDSMAGLGEHKDRHAHIGEGKIGSSGFKALLRHPRLNNIPFVLETPHDGKHISDLKKLKSFRSK